MECHEKNLSTDQNVAHFPLQQPKRANETLLVFSRTSTPLLFLSFVSHPLSEGIQDAVTGSDIDQVVST